MSLKTVKKMISIGLKKMGGGQSVPENPGKGMTLQVVEDIPFKKSTAKSYDLSELKSDNRHYSEIVVDFANEGLDVVTVYRLENEMKLEAYVADKKLIYNHKSKLDPEYKLNEKYLYHGTAAKIDDICECGLDDKLSGDGCFGKGIYFSDNPRKCVKYANRRDGETGLILCCRVILGDSKVYPKGKQDRNLRREPEKIMPFTGYRFYDSVQGCPTNFTEFVVYRTQKVLIEYLVSYTKLSAMKPRKVCQPVQEQPRLSEESSIPTSLPENSADLQIPGTMSSPDSSHSPSCTIDSNLSGKLNHTVEPSKNPIRSESSSDESSASEDDDDDHLPDGNTSMPSRDEEHGASHMNTTKDEDATSSDEEDDPGHKDINRDHDRNICVGGNDQDYHRSSSVIKNQVNTSGSRGNRQEEERILALKAREFSLQTGEFTEVLVETFLLASHFDVAGAVDLYNNKKIKDAEKESRKGNESETNEQTDGKGDGAGIGEPLYVQGKTVPTFNSHDWKAMSQEDQGEVINIMIDNFLSVTSLSDEHSTLALRHLKMAGYDLDQALVSYYQSIG